MATPQLANGAPVLVVIYSPEAAWDSATTAEGGMFGGWTFVHGPDADAELDLRFAEDIDGIDPHVEEVVERAIPGTYSRDTVDSPFEREWDDDDDDTDR